MLLGIGDGTFSNAISYQAGGTNALAVAMGDVNGDGKVDVIVASNCLNNNDCSTGSVSVLMSNGDGTLQSRLPMDQADKVRSMSRSRTSTVTRRQTSLLRTTVRATTTARTALSE